MSRRRHRRNRRINWETLTGIARSQLNQVGRDIDGKSNQSDGEDAALSRAMELATDKQVDMLVTLGVSSALSILVI